MSSGPIEVAEQLLAPSSQQTPRGHASLRIFLLMMVATVVGVGGAGLAVVGLVSPPVAVVVTIGLSAVAVAVAGTVRSGHGEAGHQDLPGLAAVIDRERRDGVLTRPVAAIVLELRGLAADTLVDGAAAWSEPVGVIARRLVTADLGTDHVIARIGPHTFGAVVSAPDRASGVAAGESLVALCRVPIRTPLREIRVEAVAGVSHAAAGEPVRGEELLRAADAALRVDGKVAAPVVMSDSRLIRHARRVIEVEAEIRHSLDVDLLTARLVPVVDVHNDEVIGLRSDYDWTAVSNTDPEILRSIAGSLGLRRSIETQYLMRSISAAESLPGDMARPVVARIDPDRLTDERAVSQLGLLIRASGIDPERLVFEFDCWGAETLGADAHHNLAELGVGCGLALRHRGTWDRVPAHLVGRIHSLSVAAHDLLDDDGRSISALRISRLLRLVEDEASKVIVTGVDSAAVALELSAAGLAHQCGAVHGQAMAAQDLRTWLTKRSTL